MEQFFRTNSKNSPLGVVFAIPLVIVAMILSKIITIVWREHGQD